MTVQNVVAVPIQNQNQPSAILENNNSRPPPNAESINDKCADPSLVIVNLAVIDFPLQLTGPRIRYSPFVHRWTNGLIAIIVLLFFVSYANGSPATEEFNTGFTDINNNSSGQALTKTYHVLVSDLEKWRRESSTRLSENSTGIDLPPPAPPHCFT